MLAREQAKRKRQHMGNLKIVVAGCVAQQEGAALLRRVPEVDLVMGPQYANRCGTFLGVQQGCSARADWVESVVLHACTAIIMHPCSLTF